MAYRNRPGPAGQLGRSVTVGVARRPVVDGGVARAVAAEQLIPDVWLPPVIRTVTTTRARPEDERTANAVTSPDKGGAPGSMAVLVDSRRDAIPAGAGPVTDCSCRCAAVASSR